jgi:hypothetical protein
MSEKNIDEQVDKLEEAAEKYASANTVISIGGYAFTPAKLMIAGTIVSTILGGLYGAFEVYKDYMDMKDKIANYVAPDLSELQKKLEVIEASVNKSTEYTQDIKNDLKNDIRRLETVVENVERSSKSGLRDADQTVNSTKKEVDQAVKEIRKESDSAIKDIRRYSDQTIKEINQELTRSQKENQQEIKQLRREIDEKIKKALDNPLAN